MVYISPISRLKEFVIGMLSGLFFIQWVKRSSPFPKHRLRFTILEILVITTLVLGYSQVGDQSWKLAFQINSDPAIPALYIDQTLTAILFALTITVFAIQRGALSRLFSHKVLVLGGEISFSVYLFHQILLIWQHNNPWVLGWCPEGGRFILYLIATLSFSYIIWRWFECPMRVLIRRALSRG